MAALAGVVIVPLLLLGIVQSVYRQNLSTLLRSVLVNVPLAVLLTAVAVKLVQLGLAVTDALSSAVAHGAGLDSGHFMASVLTACPGTRRRARRPRRDSSSSWVRSPWWSARCWCGSSSSSGPPPCMSPCSSSRWPWPAWRGRPSPTGAGVWWTRWSPSILGKFVIVSVLSLAAGALAGGTGSSTTGATPTVRPRAEGAAGVRRRARRSRPAPVVGLRPVGPLPPPPVPRGGSGRPPGRPEPPCPPDGDGSACGAWRRRPCVMTAGGALGVGGAAVDRGVSSAEPGGRFGPGGRLPGRQRWVRRPRRVPGARRTRTRPRTVVGRHHRGRDHGASGTRIPMCDVHPEATAAANGLAPRAAGPVRIDGARSARIRAPRCRRARSRRAPAAESGLRAAARASPAVRGTTSWAATTSAPNCVDQAPATGRRATPRAQPVGERRADRTERVRYRFSPLERRGVIAGWRGGQIAAVAVGLVVGVLVLRSRPSVAGILIALVRRRTRPGRGLLAHPGTDGRAVAAPGRRLGLGAGRR